MEENMNDNRGNWAQKQKRKTNIQKQLKHNNANNITTELSKNYEEALENQIAEINLGTGKKTT